MLYDPVPDIRIDTTYFAVQGLLTHVNEPAFQKRWATIKQNNKERLARHVEATLGLKINTHAMFDVQIKVGGLWLWLWLWRTWTDGGGLL